MRGSPLLFLFLFLLSRLISFHSRLTINVRSWSVVDVQSVVSMCLPVKYNSILLINSALLLVLIYQSLPIRLRLFWFINNLTKALIANFTNDIFCCWYHLVIFLQAYMAVVPPSYHSIWLSILVIFIHVSILVIIVLWLILTLLLFFTFH